MCIPPVADWTVTATTFDGPDLYIPDVVIYTFDGTQKWLRNSEQVG
jgi:hypothetical protein